MSLAILWHPAALAALCRIHWQASAAIDAAVIRFAETGKGDVERTLRAIASRLDPTT